MKVLTKNQWNFAGLLFVITVLFRFFLSSTLENERFTMVWIVAASYGIAIFIIGWTFGKKDKLTLPVFDIGFKFHLITYVICNFIAELWFLLEFQSRYENVKSVHLTVIFWGLGLLLHFVLFLMSRKFTIKGLKKSDIFD